MQMRANNVLVRPMPWTEKKLGSIFLPEGDKRFEHGTVQAVGPGLFLPSGERPPIEVSKGDHILYYKASAVDITVQECAMHIVQEREILAILEPGDLTVSNKEGKQ